jgi:predicted TIM-barrel fold metal-dependent hydrolase
MSERLIFVSADGHAAAPIDTYRPYLESKYHAALDELRAEQEEYQKRIAGPAHPAPEAMQAFDDRGAMAQGGEAGSYDLSVRLREMDAEGCAAEIVHHGTQAAPPLWYGTSNREHPPELRQVGMRAHHRWLADLMSASNGRLFGVAEAGTCLDMQETVQELNWAADHHFVSVSVPGNPADPSLPPLSDPYYEPFWATCAERGLVLSVHAGWGQAQGSIYRFFELVAKRKQQMGGEIDRMQIEKLFREELDNAQDSPFQLEIGPRRVMWQLMLSGAFDRYPKLRLAMTEIRADWLPPTLAALDKLAAQTQSGLKHKPSEYYLQHCAVAPSSLHRSEVDMRYDIGVQTLLFGMDYPHHEGTWPNSKEWIQASLAGIPTGEARDILGENAIRIYGLDRAKLAQVAARIGPVASEVLLPQHNVPQRLIDHFHKRSGYNREPEAVDTSAIARAFKADLATVAA